ncbi:MAG TPA: DUF389 domain-containing protein [Telluria sp.]
MQSPSTNPVDNVPLLARARAALAHRFSLREDQAEHDVIDQRIRAGVELWGATPWILMFAIFIASIGLNVNSAAVIIGAMLISPLMGPIMGIGYGVAIYDFPLIRRALANLAIAAVISVLTSALYFVITPLDQAQSELLARTTPTIWDVLIALFGGLAGIVASTRREHSNVVPGVAIATALMPPLCTAGYGIAHLNWDFVLGALYLFSINSVFIAVSVVLVTGLLHLPQRNFVDRRIERRLKAVLLVVVLATTIPSAYLAFNMVRAEVFRTSAQAFIKREFQFKHTSVVAMALVPEKAVIEVTLTGDPLTEADLDAIKARLPGAGLGGAHVIVHQGADRRVDVNLLKQGILEDLYRANVDTLRERDTTIRKLQAELEERKVRAADTGNVLVELEAQYPALSDAVVGYGQAAGASGAAPVPFLAIRPKKPLARAEHERLLRWFRARMKNAAAMVVVGTPERARR